MARLLAFDTAQGALSVAVVEGQRLLAYRFELRTRGHAEALAPMIEMLLSDAGLRISDLDALAVTIGPGTFTGLRIGLATARGLALASSLPLIGVTTFEALAEPITLGNGEAVTAVFDAKRGEIYLQAFGPALMPLTSPMLVPLTKAAAHLPAVPLALVGTGAALLIQTLAGQPARLADASAQPDATSVAHIAHARLSAYGVEAFHTPPSPLYLRAPDAKLPGGVSLPDIFTVGADDASRLAVLHALCFDVPWSEKAIAELLSMPGAFAFATGEREAGFTAFVLARIAVDEAEILSIGVVPHLQGAGLGHRLLLKAATASAALGARSLFLEVAANNHAAIGLYAKAGFCIIGERPGYYRQKGTGLGPTAVGARVLRLDLPVLS